VDADATPAAVKEILYRTAARRQVTVLFVANSHLTVPRSPHLKSIQVSGGFDIADDYIAEQVAAGDLVITQDIPLAAQVIAKGAHVIDNRGEQYTADNIRPRLNMRDFMDHAHQRRPWRRPTTVRPAGKTGLCQRAGPLAGTALARFTSPARARAEPGGAHTRRSK
jgi:uncharacterized protein